MKKIKVKPNKKIIKCPKCGNNTIFDVHSQQICEDLCEVWVECNCGYDPTAEQIGLRYENVWGGIYNANVVMSLACWNSAIHTTDGHTATDLPFARSE